MTALITEERYVIELQFGIDGVESLLSDIAVEKGTTSVNYGEVFAGSIYTGISLDTPTLQLRRFPWVMTEKAGKETKDRSYEFNSVNYREKDTVQKQLEELGYK